jgi:hypothetical protein
VENRKNGAKIRTVQRGETNRSGRVRKTLLVEDLTGGSRRVVIKVLLNEETEAALIDDLISNAG